MRLLWLAAGLLISHSAFAICPPGESKIGYSYCVRYTILDVKSHPAWVTRFFYGKKTYGHRRVLRVRVTEVKIPQADLQAKDAPLKLMPGTVLKLGIDDSDHSTYQTNLETHGLVEEECHDKGEADYEFALNPKLVAKAVGPGGVGRDSEIEVDCTPPAEVVVPAPVSDTKTP